MSKLIDIIDANKLFDFKGGIHPPSLKSQSNQSPSRHFPMSDRFYIHSDHHLGTPGLFCVKPGDKVLKGQAITHALQPDTLAVHSPTSGTVVEIAHYPSTHPSGMATPCAIIEADGNDTPYAWPRYEDYRAIEPLKLVGIIRDMGIAGLGGATFPTYRKLATSGLELLIVNGVECEPYITSDDRLMRERAHEIIQGIEISQHITKAKRIVIAIEDDKPEAIQMMRQAASKSTLAITVQAIPTKYPSGGEKQLIEIITGLQVPSGSIPMQIGCLVQNVATLFAMKRAIIDGEAQIERMVTLTGGAVVEPQNYWIRVGTPINFILDNIDTTAKAKTIVGGPMMGFELIDSSSPLHKSCNCLLLPGIDEFIDDPHVDACIRCGECDKACPADLLPQQLHWFATSSELEKARQYNLFDCIECGACAYVCPSNIPLVHQYRIAKAELRRSDIEQQQAEQAKLHFEARQKRLEDEKLAREAKHKAAAAKRKASMSNQDKDLIAAAMARAKASKAPAADEPSAPNNAKANVAAAIARAKAKKAAAQAGAKVDNPVDNTLDDSGDQSASQDTLSAKVEAKPKTDAPLDDKKAKVAAAIAKAKAKKAAKEQNLDGDKK